MSEMDALLNVMRGRRSVRAFEDRPVPRPMLERLVEAAVAAPSAGNRQDWHFAVVTSGGLIRQIEEAALRRWGEIAAANAGRGVAEEMAAYGARYSRLCGAPAVVAVSTRAVNGFQRHVLGDDAHATIGGAASAAMAAQNLMLAAHAAGLGTCCLTGPLAAAADLARILNLGRRHEIVCLIALGWPAQAPPAPPRKPLDEIARFIE